MPETAPIVGLSDHVTAVLADPLTVAVNCWDWELASATAVGRTVTDTGDDDGDRFTVAKSDLVGSSTLVAATTTVCADSMVAGAVYSPVPEMVPTVGLMDHVTDVLEVPLMVAVNWRVCEGPSVTLEGLRVTEIDGTRVITADADLVTSATLVAVTVTDRVAVTGDGAVYKPPAEIDPTSGLSDQVTAVLAVPATVAVNWRVCEAERVTEDGVIVTDTVAERFTVAEADFVESATLVAVIVTACAVEIEAGAVKSPVLEMVPTFGLRDHVTVVSLAPVTVAVNC